MKNRNPDEVERLFDELESVTRRYKVDRSRILWGLSKWISKTEIARRLEIDRKTLYTRMKKDVNEKTEEGANERYKFLMCQRRNRLGQPPNTPEDEQFLKKVP